MILSNFPLELFQGCVVGGLKDQNIIQSILDYLQQCNISSHPNNVHNGTGEQGTVILNNSLLEWKIHNNHNGEQTEEVYRASICWDSTESLQFVQINPREISFEYDSIYIGKTTNKQLVRNGLDSFVFGRPPGGRGEVHYSFMPFVKGLQIASGINIWKHQFTIAREGFTLFMLVYATEKKVPRTETHGSIIKTYINNKKKKAKNQQNQSPTEWSPEIEDDVSPSMEIDSQIQIADSPSLQTTPYMPMDPTTNPVDFPVLNSVCNFQMTDGKLGNYDLLYSQTRALEFLTGFVQQGYSPVEPQEHVLILEGMMNAVRNLRGIWCAVRQETFSTRSMGDSSHCFNVAIRICKNPELGSQECNFQYTLFEASPRIKASNECKGEWLVVESGTTIRLIIETIKVEGMELLAKILQLQPGFTSEDVKMAIQDDLEFGEDLSMRDGRGDRDFQFNKSDGRHQSGLLLIKLHSPLWPSEALGCVALPVLCV